jgi:acyl carrier protein
MNPSPDSAATEPFEEISNTIKTIWCEVLGLSSVELDQHFLDLGGDSLDAMRCASRLQDAFGIDLTLQDFFMDDATVHGQAILIGHKSQE